MPDDSRLDLIEPMLNHAWSYFQLHAQQRLTAFNFYIVLSSVLTAGLFAALQKDDIGLVPAAIGFLLGIISFVFAKLDGRNKQLTRNGERALRSLQQDWLATWPDEILQSSVDVFSRDERTVSAARARDTVWSVRKRHWSFSDCFGMAFRGLGTLGVDSVGVTLLLWAADHWQLRAVG